MTQIRNNLKNAVDRESEQDLIRCLNFNLSDKIDSSCHEIIESALIGKWHNRHGDLVSTIYLKNLIDDRFVEPILNIAIDKNIFRWDDDELESTLRKCIHALKNIGSKKSEEALEKLKKLNNSNIKCVLEMYR